MAFQTSLLDTIAIEMNCEYISDLKYLNQEQRLALAEKLQRISIKAEEQALLEWNNVLVYLTGSAPAKTVPAAKSRLIELLCK